MRAVVCNEFGPPETLAIETRPDLEPRADQVVVDVRACGVNYVDGLFVQAKYQIKPPLPFTPGGEIAGTISAVGVEASGWAVGDRVMAMTGLGGFATQVALNPFSLYRMPDNLSFGAAATFIQSYATCLFALTRRTQVAEGEWVLVLGAGGGVGLAAIEVARSLGARVIAAASSDDKRAAALARGAEAVIDYTTEDLKTRARELSGGGVDVVIDPVGGPHAEPALRALKVFGRFVVIGFAGGGIPSLPANQVLLNNRTVVGVDWGAWTMRDAAGNRALLTDALAMVADGRLNPVEPTTYQLESVGQALNDLLDRRVAGKVALVP